MTTQIKTPAPSSAPLPSAAADVMDGTTLATASSTDLGITEAAAVLARHAHNPSAFLALNAETQRFTVPGIDGLIAYRPAGSRHLVQLGGVFADDADADRLLEAFLAYARDARRRVVGVQLLAGDTARYAAHGFRIEQLGASYAVALEKFSLGGKHFMSLRNKISRARRSGVVVDEVGVDVPSSPDLARRLDAVDATWLRSKGAHVKELAFMVGERGGAAEPLRRLFVARLGEQVLGYISFSPAYGRDSGWLHDLSRRDPAAPPGTTELLVVTAVDRFREERAGWLHFGLTPFTGLADDHVVAGAGSPIARRAVRALAEHGRAIYPAAAQLAYKLKWSPSLVQPEYVAFSGRVTFGAVWALLRLTRAA
jgi:lysylphosphatidylglycerol synthetase-like protein (DUF2156 family)